MLTPRIQNRIFPARNGAHITRASRLPEQIDFPIDCRQICIPTRRFSPRKSSQREKQTGDCVRTAFSRRALIDYERSGKFARKRA